MDFEECKQYTFNEKVLHLLDLLEKKKYSSFEKETGLAVKEVRGAIQIGSKIMSQKPESFTFALVQLLQKTTQNWKTMSEKQKVEAFKELFLSKTQKYAFRERRKLFGLLERILSEKRMEEFSVIKNGNLTDFTGLDFDRASYLDSQIKEKGPIVWKRNTPPPPVYNYI